MNAVSHAIKGVMHGKTIELFQEPGLPEEQEVTVTLQPVEAAARRLPPGEGLRRSFGAWADDAKELDEFVEESRRSRKRHRAEIE